MTLELQIQKLIATSFGVDVQLVDKNTSMDNLPEWDSLNQLRLVLELEESFDIALEPEDIAGMQCFMDVLAVVQKFKAAPAGDGNS